MMKNRMLLLFAFCGSLLGELSGRGGVRAEDGGEVGLIVDVVSREGKIKCGCGRFHGDFGTRDVSTHGPLDQTTLILIPDNEADFETPARKTPESSDCWNHE
ncbi:hypothetical protein V6N13_131736 [Hibiscus sabdariffa]